MTLRRFNHHPLREAVVLVCYLATLSVAPTVSAWPESRIVTGPRVELGELLPEAPEVMRAIDICPTPRVGTSRLIEKQVIERQVRAAGFDLDGLKLPASIRVERDGRRFAANELGQMLEEPVRRALPPGVTLIQVEATVSMVLEVGATPAPISLPKLPRRVGAVRVAFSAEFPADGAPIRVPFTAVVQISEQATRTAMTRGQRVQLAIVRGPARITADAIALSDGNVGEELQFRVTSTGKVLRGLLVSATRATVKD